MTSENTSIRRSASTLRHGKGSRDDQDDDTDNVDNIDAELSSKRTHLQRFIMARGKEKVEADPIHWDQTANL